MTENMKENGEERTEKNLAEENSPNFFQNSCPGSGATEEAEIAGESPRSAEDVDGLRRENVVGYVDSLALCLVFLLYFCLS